MEPLNALVAVHAPLLTSNLTDVESFLVEAYLRQVRQNRAAVTLLLEERLKQFFQDHHDHTKHPAKYQNELTDVVAVSRVSDMFLGECEAEILSLYIGGDLIRPYRGTATKDQDTLLVTDFGGIALKVAKKVLQFALEKLLPLLESLADSASAPEAVKHLIALLKGVLQGKFDKDTLAHLLEVMSDCVDLVPAGTISTALKVAIVALKKLLQLI